MQSPTSHRLAHRTSRVDGSLILALAVLLSGVAMPAFAQVSTSAPRPVSPLFNSGRNDANAGQYLDLTMSLTEAYDSDTPIELRPIVAPRDLQSGGFSSIVYGAADYGRQGRSVQLGATAASTLRYFPEIGELRSVTHNGGIGLDAQLGSRATLFINQSVAYSPSYLYQLFHTVSGADPGEVLTGGSDYEVNEQKSVSYRTSARLGRSIGVRGRFSATGEFRYSDYIGQTTNRQDVQEYSLGAQFGRGIARTGEFNVGYTYRESDLGYAGAAKTLEHGLTFGMRFSPALSASRRATLGFRVGASLLDRSGLTQDILVAGRGHRYVGEMSVGYPFARRWQATAFFRRGIQYAPEVAEPVLTNGATAVLQGTIGRRVGLVGSVAYVSGGSAFTPSRILDSRTASVRVNAGLTSALAVYVEGLYYYYNFARSELLAPETPSSLERTGLRGGLTVSLSALRR